MKQSSYLQTIGDESGQICFHSLYGIGSMELLFDPEYIKTLNSFKEPRELVGDDKSPVIQDLIDVGFLVEDSLSREEERGVYDKSVEDWLEEIVGGAKIDYLDLMISEACNFACGHCSRKFTMAEMGKKQAGLMSWDIAKKSIDYYLKAFPCSKDNAAEIHFGSDEPLLNWPVLKKAVFYIKERSKNAVLTVNTNLSLLDRTKADFLKLHDVEIIASLDGLQEGNDLVRVLANGRGTFERVLSKAQLLKEIAYPINGFITTILDNNWDYVNEDFIDWLEAQGYSGLAIDVDLANSMNHSPKECVEKITSLYDEAQSRDMFCGGAWTNPFNLLLGGARDGMPAHCKSIKGRGLAVSSDGTIRTCSGSCVDIGHINDPREVFDEGSVYHELIASKMRTVGTSCDGCMLEAVCKNQCFISSTGLGRPDTSRKREMCEILRGATTHLLKRQLKKETADV